MKKLTPCVIRESEQKRRSFTVIAGNFEGLNSEQNFSISECKRRLSVPNSSAFCLKISSLFQLLFEVCVIRTSVQSRNRKKNNLLSCGICIEKNTSKVSRCNESRTTKMLLGDRI